jgi:hypothetical protein
VDITGFSEIQNKEVAGRLEKSMKFARFSQTQETAAVVWLL